MRHGNLVSLQSKLKVAYNKNAGIYSNCWAGLLSTSVSKKQQQRCVKATQGSEYAVVIWWQWKCQQTMLSFGLVKSLPDVAGYTAQWCWTR